MTIWEIHIKYLAAHRSRKVISKKNTCMIVLAVSWPSHFFHEAPFLLERTTWKTIISQTRVLLRHFLVNEWGTPVTLRKTTDSTCYQWLNWSFQTKIKILETSYIPHWDWKLSIIKDFSDVISGFLTNVIFW